MRSRFAAKADEIVYGDREETYNDPNKNFRNIAQVWSGILGIPIKPSQVGLMMAGLKLVRENHKHQDDNLIDAHGYLICVERILAQSMGKETSRMAHHVAERKADLEAELSQVGKLAATPADHTHGPPPFPELSEDWRDKTIRRRPPVDPEWPRDALDMG